MKKWNNDIQDFLDIDSTEEGESIEIFSLSLCLGYISAARNMELDPYLADFPMEKMNLWKELSAYITPAVLERLEVFKNGIFIYILACS